jgi:hypothetical protein
MGAYVATAAMSVTLPLTSTLWNGFAFQIMAQGGAVTLAPNAADKVSGGAAGAAATIPMGVGASAWTDGAGNWWLTPTDIVTYAQYQQNAPIVHTSLGGSSDAITAAYSPAITTLTNGMSVLVRPSSANATATPTFTPNSGVLSPVTIVKGNSLPLVPGDIAAGGHWIELQYDTTLAKWVLLNPATGIGHMGQRTVYSAAGTYTFTAAITGPHLIEVWGGGAGGGSSASSSTGGGGGAGGYCKGIVSLVAGTGYTVTVGAGGTGAAANNAAAGGGGGTSSFSSLLSATGGTGGIAGAGSVQGASGAGTGGDEQLSAAYKPQLSSNGTGFYQSPGADAPRGGAGGWSNGTNTTIDACAPGGGGCGGWSGYRAGNGAVGRVIVQW